MVVVLHVFFNDEGQACVSAADTAWRDGSTQTGC